MNYREGDSGGKKIDALTSLRFFAAFAVFIYHAQLLAFLLARYRFGDVGVGFFFLLSGFIVTYVYHTKLRTFSWPTAFKFYYARIAKIYPMHLITFLAATPGMLKSFGVVLGGPFSSTVAIAAIANLTLTQGYFSRNVWILYSFNNVSWTLSLEALFYIVFPVIVLVLGGRLAKSSVRQIVALGVGLWLVMIMLCMILPTFVLALPPLRLPEFVIGVLAAFLFINYPALGSALGTSKATALEVFALIAVLCNVALIPFVPKITVAIQMTPTLILLIAVFAYQRGLVSKLLTARPFVLLGEASFSFYMIHMLILGTLGAAGNTWLTLVAAIDTIVLSILIYRNIEKPLRKKTRRLLENVVERQRSGRVKAELEAKVV